MCRHRLQIMRVDWHGKLKCYVFKCRKCNIRYSRFEADLWKEAA